LRSGRGVDPSKLGVVVLGDGSPAWLVGTARGDQVIRTGRRGRVLARGDIANLVVDDGWTLIWVDDAGQAFATDARRPRVVHGCPVRSRYRAELATADVRITTAYVIELDVAVVRGCVRGTGRDRILSSGTDFDPGQSTRYVTASGTWLLAVDEFGDRYSGCTDAYVRTLDLRTMRQGRIATRDDGGCDRGRAPDRGGQAAITASGVPAWVGVTPDGVASVRTLDPAGAIVDLDSGPVRSITGLRADGDGFSWTHDGQPRHAAAP
jgi:hypothetical protein